MRLMKLAILAMLTSCLFSCKKETDFVKLTLKQEGKQIKIEGYSERPMSVDWAYSAQVVECDKIVERVVVIPKGQTYGYFTYQADCQIQKWRLNYDGPWSVLTDGWVGEP